MTAIEFQNISKQYRLGLVSTRTLSHDLNRWWKMSILGKEDPYLKIGEVNDRASKGDSDYVWALRDINFKVEQGDVLGIIGKNGAGKSTLLKILSKVTTPTTGTIKARGRIASLLEVGTGFHPEMTGRENIFMNGAIMGMTKAEISRKLDEIIDFAGVERYIDTPVKRYSSGMTVRLGFAIAAHLEPEILVVDEVLAVGDAEFQKKAIGKMQDVSKGEGRTVLFVSHNMGSLQSLCRNGILLENGVLSYGGDIESTISKYLSLQNVELSYHCIQDKNSSIFIKSIYIVDNNNQNKNTFFHTDKIIVKVNLTIKERISESYLLLTILDRSKRKVFSAEKKVENQMSLEIASEFLTRGIYSIQAVVYKPAVTQYDYLEDVCSFDVVDAGSHFSHLETYDYGSVFGQYSWIDL
ncbi:MAG: ABC transporter ATP-binding protein [Bacteroidales bacterium 36-12]|nr:MAG: ABC transporter ATP-binding protein [Bacteroidales bacterium 36-12]